MRTISLGPIKDGVTFSFYVINKSPTLSAYFDYPLIATISIAGLGGKGNHYKLAAHQHSGYYPIVRSFIKRRNKMVIRETIRPAEICAIFA